MPDLSQWVEFTLRLPCAVNCAYCCQERLTKNYMLRGGGDLTMSFSNFKTILDHIPLDRVRVDFSGIGDCSFHPELVNFMEEVSRRNGTMVVFTTFQGMKRDDFDRFCQIPIYLLSVHLPSVHQDHMQTQWTDDYRYCLDGLVSRKPKAEVFDFMCMIGPPSADPDIQRLAPLRIMEVQPRGGNITWLGVDTTQKRGALTCSRSPTLHQNVVFPNGDVYLCCVDQGLLHKLGNLLTENFYDLDCERENIIARQKECDPSLMCKRCEFAKVNDD